MLQAYKNMLSKTFGRLGCYAINARILDLKLTRVGTLCIFVRCCNKKFILHYIMLFSPTLRGKIN